MVGVRVRLEWSWVLLGRLYSWFSPQTQKRAYTHPLRVQLYLDKCSRIECVAYSKDSKVCNYPFGNTNLFNWKVLQMPFTLKVVLQLQDYARFCTYCQQTEQPKPNEHFAFNENSYCRVHDQTSCCVCGVPLLDLKPWLGAECIHFGRGKRAEFSSSCLPQGVVELEFPPKSTIKHACSTVSVHTPKIVSQEKKDEYSKHYLSGHSPNLFSSLFTKKAHNYQDHSKTDVQQSLVALEINRLLHAWDAF